MPNAVYESGTELTLDSSTLSNLAWALQPLVWKARAILQLEMLLAALKAMTLVLFEATWFQAGSILAMAFRQSPVELVASQILGALHP